ncbi:MAG: FAD-dependent oxidoreductase [Deltaproteobacteria bacterium]|nr:MAG: FAD-dependent oxidoreductase [Deltaproteobacteria bacterium]
MKHVVIIGGGFAGLKAAKKLGGRTDVKVTLIDRGNHHLFQPLLYQVATAGLGQSDIAVPIRSLLAEFPNIFVLKGEVTDADLENRTLTTDFGEVSFDYLILACGVKHTYFGNDHWERYAPGLKTLEQAIEIRRRFLNAFEEAERQSDPRLRRKALTFVVVGGGPTGVELAGAIGEMSRYTLNREFRNIDPKLTRIILIEAGDRILSSFCRSQSSRATRDLEKLGVQVWTGGRVTQINDEGIEVGEERIEAGTVIWAAGVAAPEINAKLGVPLDSQGRIIVEKDLSLPGHPNVFSAGDQASFSHQTGEPLPCLSPVAIQMGGAIAENIVCDIYGIHRRPFRYTDKGQMATIGRSTAIVDLGYLRLNGFLAWVTWIFVHIYFIAGFNNRMQVFIKWYISYLSNKKGSRIIFNRKWWFYDDNTCMPDPDVFSPEVLDRAENR